MTSPASPGFVGQNSTPLSGFSRGIFLRLSRRSLQQTGTSVQKTNSQRPTDGSSRTSLDNQSDLCSFQSLWHEARTLMNGSADVPEHRTSTTSDSCEMVINKTLQMIKILTKKGDASDSGSQTNECDSRILDYFYSENVLVKLLDWAERRPEFEQRLKLHLLCLFDCILGQCICQFFMDRQILMPLLKLITSCSEVKDAKNFEEKLAVVFHHLCFGISQYSEVLEALFSEAYMSSGAGGHSLISALICYIHWDGPVGQQARDALHVIVCLSSTHEEVSSYVVSKSNFCPVLAAGLTGLYSSLPRKLAYSSDDWSGITEEDIRSSQDLQRFLTSLAFCNDIVKVSPPAICQHLLEFIYNGFLVPVIAPGLHQGAIGVDEVIATTAYLNLFLTKITEPHLLRVFLQFILLVKVDELSILDLLIQRIANPQPKLCIITLVLFKTLVELNCEDVMYRLIFKYLMPCTHVMVSQQRSIADVDLYCRNAEKLLSLIPECCTIDTSRNQSSLSSVNPLTDSVTPSRSDSLSHFERSKWWQSIRRKKTPSNNRTETLAGLPATATRSSVGDISSLVQQEDLMESSYVEYLRVARICLDQCKRACKTWTMMYDGRNASLAADGRLSPAETQPKRISVSEVDTRLSEVAIPATYKKMLDATMRVESRIAEDASSPSKPVVSSASVQTRGMHFGDSGLQGVHRADGSVQGTSVLGDGLWAASEVASGRSGLGFVRELNRVPSSTGVSSSFSGLSEDFDTFLVQLSRVQVPDSESRLEEILNELDSLLMVAENRKNATSGIMPVVTNTLTGFSEAASSPDFSDQVARTLPHVVVGTASDSCPTEQPDSETLTATTSDFIPTSLEPKKLEIERSENQNVLLRPISLDLPVLDGRIRPSLGSPSSARNSALSPTVGPFLTTLLHKLESMKQNTFYVNLHLTGLLSRLACYPQPLLQSLLLSQTLVFQPSVKSLAQVLNSVKCRLDEYFLTVSEKDLMMIQAQHYLRYRNGQMRNDTRMSLGDIRLSSPAVKVAQSKQSKLTLLGSRHGARYIPHSPVPGHPSMTQDSPEFVEKKNAIYCALVLKEFLKELAAISQEHTVLQMQSCLP